MKSKTMKKSPMRFCSCVKAPIITLPPLDLTITTCPFKASKAFAFVNGREFVTPDDVKSLAVNILSHRLILSPKGKAAYNTNEQAVEAILEKIKVPSIRN